MNNNIKKIILLFGDIFILYLALYFTLFIRYGTQPSFESWQGHLRPFSLIFAVWIIIFYISNLYNLYLAVNNSKFIQLAIRSISIAGLLSAVFFYLNPNIGIAPKTNLLIYLVIFTLFFIIWRRFYNWSLRAYLPRNKIAVIGYSPEVRELIASLEANPHLGYKIVAIINNMPIEPTPVPVVKDLNNLDKFFYDKKISTVVLAGGWDQARELQTSLFGCLHLKINFISLPNFYEIVTGKVPIEAISQMWFFENLSEGSKKIFDMIKRLYDIIFAFIILIVTLPFWPVIGMILVVNSPGPVFFRQVRAGKNNIPFMMIKFRTMSVANNDFSPTRNKDERITRFGNFLRSTRIDEIPQVLNILAGDLSFVGPRPERPEIIKELEKNIPFYRERMLVKPGLTGWDQISGEYHSPSREDTLKKLQYDLFYIKNRSLYLDLSIILKTIATVISRAGV